MPVSAILLAALAPITGALFGASYGTAIRIGYEIIFPALFADMINDQKNGKVPSGNEEGAKRTIKALHTMFTATGGASAMEFGIEQGIEMAKKKTESQDVQDMIDLSLGLTDRQLNKRGKSQQFQDTIKESEEEKEEIIENIEDFDARGSSDFLDLSPEKIYEFFEKVSIVQIEEFHKKFKKEITNGITRLKVKRIVDRRLSERKTTEESISETTTEGSLVREIATRFNVIRKSLLLLQTYKNMVNKIAGANLRVKRIKIIRIQISKFNQFVQENRKPKFALNTEKSIAAMRPVPK